MLSLRFFYFFCFFIITPPPPSFKIHINLGREGGGTGIVSWSVKFYNRLDFSFQMREFHLCWFLNWENLLKLNLLGFFFLFYRDGWFVPMFIPKNSSVRWQQVFLWRMFPFNWGTVIFWNHIIATCSCSALLLVNTVQVSLIKMVLKKIIIKIKIFSI